MIYPTLRNWIRARINGAGWALRGWFQSIVRLTEAFRARLQRQAALRRNRRRNFRYEMAVCSIFRNEAPFLQEWLTLHHGVGVDKFYLYNDLSSDNYKEVLEPWIRRGLVEILENPNGWKQKQAYNNCIRKFRMQCRWIAFIDIDEFLFSPATRDLRSVLRDYPDAAAIFVYWRMFGSNGHRTRPAGNVIENYTRCIDTEEMLQSADPVWKVKNGFISQTTGDLINGKSIVNPRLVAAAGIHKPAKIIHGHLVDESGRHLRAPKSRDFSFSRLRINHYWSKSHQDLKSKVLRHIHWFDRNQVALPNGAPPIGSHVKCEHDLDEWLKVERKLNSCVDNALLEIWKEIGASNSHPN